MSAVVPLEVSLGTVDIFVWFGVRFKEGVFMSEFFQGSGASGE